MGSMTDKLKIKYPEILEENRRKYSEDNTECHVLIDLCSV